MDANEELDIVLAQYIIRSDRDNKNKIDGICSYLNEGEKLGRIVQNTYVKELVDELVDDGFVLWTQFQGAPQHYLLDEYTLKFKGRLFYEAGGYVQRAKDLETQREINDRNAEKSRTNEKKLVTWTVVASIVASLLLIVELTRFFADHPDIFGFTQCCYPE